jgi:hypothetical protein
VFLPDDEPTRININGVKIQFGELDYHYNRIEIQHELCHFLNTKIISLVIQMQIVVAQQFEDETFGSVVILSMVLSRVSCRYIFCRILRWRRDIHWEGGRRIK